MLIRLAVGLLGGAVRGGVDLDGGAERGWLGCG